MKNIVLKISTALVCLSSAPSFSQANIEDTEHDEGITAPLRTNHHDAYLTAQLRRELAKLSALSSGAKNAKLVTRGKGLALKGTVLNSVERTQVASLAQVIAGSEQVRDDLKTRKHLK